VLYRHRGRLRRLTLGSADSLGVADARKRARDAVRDAQDGGDPAAEKQKARKAETIADLATDYIDRYAKKRKRSWKADDRILRTEILPRWRHRAIADITRRDVRILVDAIAERGAPIMANRTTALLSKVFKFALDDELIEASPAVRIPRPAAEQQRDRVLSDDEVRALWQSFDALEPEMAAFYKLRLLTAQRGGEVGSMRWQDVDLAGGWWTIPSTRSKNKRPHRVPLSPTALEMLQALRAQADEKLRARRAAPSRKKNAKPIADPVYVLEGARGKRQQSEAAATFAVPDFRAHDLRRTAASNMASGGIQRLTISKILNHVERNITAVYDRHSFDAEKAAALSWWDVKLCAILENERATVRAFVAKGA
jgi:integrase